MRTGCADGLEEGLIPVPQPVAIRTIIPKAASRLFSKLIPSDEDPILSYNWEPGA